VEVSGQLHALAKSPCTLRGSQSWCGHSGEEKMSPQPLRVIEPRSSRRSIVTTLTEPISDKTVYHRVLWSQTYVCATLRLLCTDIRKCYVLCGTRLMLLALVTMTEIESASHAACVLCICDTDNTQRHFFYTVQFLCDMKTISWLFLGL